MVDVTGRPGAGQTGSQGFAVEGDASTKCQEKQKNINTLDYMCVHSFVYFVTGIIQKYSNLTYLLPHVFFITSIIIIAVRSSN